MGFFMFGKRGSSDPDEKVFQITTVGKSALAGQTVTGLEFEILDVLKAGHPCTLDILLDRLPSEKNRKFVRYSTNRLINKHYLEIQN